LPTDTYAFYKPPNQADTFGVCGMGTAYQTNVQHAPVGAAGPAFSLFHVGAPGDPNYWPELARIAIDLNSQFQARAREALKAKVQDTGRKELEVAVWFAPDGLQIIYAAGLAKKHFDWPCVGWWKALWASLTGPRATS
jgi:hypothetical protein